MVFSRLLARAQRRASAVGQVRQGEPGRLSFETLESRIALAAAGLVPVGAQPTGALTGKIVYTSGGHGWQYNSNVSRYATDRGDNNEIVEDFGNQEQMTAYVDYLFRAGATIVPMRPVGRQVHEVVLDNDSAGVAFSAGWSDSTSPQYYDENYNGDAVPYRSAATTTGAETATATYTPNIPAAGMYPVYTWVLRGTNRANQLYEINHTGGQTQVRVNHAQVGSGWVYLGTYHFDAGSSTELGSVQISNHVTTAGGVVIADAIRFGNGMGDYVASGAPGISGYPREDENSLHWIARGLGVGTSLATAASTGNVSAPSNFAEWMNATSLGDSVYIGFHSNATTGDPNTATARGAVGLIDSDQGTPNQSSLALYLGRQINQDMQALNGQFEHNWANRTTHTFTSGFGEIDLGSNAEMDATIIEVAFHDNIQDAALMRDPKARDALARATYQGTLEYFDNFGNLMAPVAAATAPVSVRAVSQAAGEVTVSWSAGPTAPASAVGGAATGFRVYASSDGYGFDGGTFVAGGATTSLTLTGYDPALPYYFRVVAVNAGGESKPSEVVTALPSGGEKQVLIVNGFDRFDRGQDFRYAYAYTGDGLVDRVWPRYNNSFDYVVQHHTAIHAAEPGTHVASTSNEAVISGAVNLDDYDVVMWILGNESTADDTFNATEQTKVSQFIAGGGHLFVSGSEIAWDLDQQNNGRTFFESTLKGNFVSDDAGTYTVNPAATGIFAGMSSNFTFSSGSPSTGANAYSTRDAQLYNVTTPDVIAAQPGAVVALNYGNGAGAAAIQVTGTGGAGNIVVFGFPFETITDAARRQTAMGAILEFFVPAPPAVALETRVDGQDADSPTGPFLSVGGLANLRYAVVNAGGAPLANVAVEDDNGTPGNPADDFSATYAGGDANSNNLLDGGETWTYTASVAVAAGQQVHTGSVTAEGNGEPVNASDAAHFFGAASAMTVESMINGDDADSPPGPSLAVGGVATFNYLVTNAGNVPLGDVVLSDDNGTPGNGADNFNPALTSGDANGNNQLDVGETWVFAADRPVVAGQQTHSVTAFGFDAASQFVFDTDTANYLGALAPTADFDGSGLVDGADFLAWQRGFGLSGGATLADGDGTRDEAVDAADLALWIDELPGAEIVAAFMAPAESRLTAVPSARVIATFSTAVASAGNDRGGADGNVFVERQLHLDRPLDGRQPWRASSRQDFDDEQDIAARRRAARSLPDAEVIDAEWAECVDKALDLASVAVRKL
jgi:hypothetical protein